MPRNVDAVEFDDYITVTRDGRTYAILPEDLATYREAVDNLEHFEEQEAILRTERRTPSGPMPTLPDLPVYEVMRSDPVVGATLRKIEGKTRTCRMLGILMDVDEGRSIRVAQDHSND